MYMLCTFDTVDGVIFSHNGANGPELNATRVFRPVRQIAALEVGSLRLHQCLHVTVLRLFIEFTGRTYTCCFAWIII